MYYLVVIFTRCPSNAGYSDKEKSRHRSSRGTFGQRALASSPPSRSVQNLCFLYVLLVPFFQTMAVTTQLVTKIGTGVIDPAELICLLMRRDYQAASNEA